MKKIPYQVRHTINLDWLELMCSGSLVTSFSKIDLGEGQEMQGDQLIDCPLDKYEYDSGRIILAKIGNGTKIFKYSYEVYISGKLFALCHLCPRQPEILKADMIQVKIENNVLYEVGCIKEIKYFLGRMSWAVTNVTRVDIALDGVSVLNLMDRFVKGEIQKKGKAGVNPFFTGKRLLTGFNVGSRASNKWITAYNKTKELELSCKKYISEFWERSGLITCGDVERLELKLKNEEIKKFPDFNWENLDNFEYLASLFRSSMKNFFEFVEINEDSNISRAKVIQFIDWDSLGANLLDRLSTQKTNEVYRMKQSAKTNFWCYLASGREYYRQIAYEQAMNVNCLDWYANKLAGWETEFHKRAGANKENLISFQYLLNFETYEHTQQLKLFQK